ncbi:MAG: HisA/HisF-related TIM barrel protein, partial [Candidatus Methylumidiphilus sp.]
MKKNRLIPVLLLRNGWLVQSKQFRRYQNLGNPISAVKRLSEWASDELIYLDISNGDSYDMRRDDLGHPNRHSILEIIEDVSKVAFMPITVGGRIRTLQDIEERLSFGADKVAINTIAIEDPQFVQTAAKEFGSQCIVVSIDVKKQDETLLVMGHGGQKPTSYAPEDWAKTV